MLVGTQLRLRLKLSTDRALDSGWCKWHVLFFVRNHTQLAEINTELVGLWSTPTEELFLSADESSLLVLNSAHTSLCTVTLKHQRQGDHSLIIHLRK